MSVILEFTIETDAFELGRVLARPPPHGHIELERVIPTQSNLMPFLWVTGVDTDAFEASVREQPSIKTIHALDHVEGSTLYRIEWATRPADILAALADADAVVLEASGDGVWEFRVRFPDHDKLSTFHNAIIKEDIPIHIDRTYTLSEPTATGHPLGLTTGQREALVLALNWGYFASPSETSLDDIADELGISRQAVSKRIRRGNETVLRKTLLSSAEDFT
ncbi:bacterio-opsin activator domain-containing protein [Halomicrobium urmianum]|uniref:bacterio-opsin activator domain-containing protein n=1 Tax=Halomicrobium urmianum TaxID=1586233 RepID=UPI001CD93437|nr:bacterio-opsin activator domain-containing protein [Halomicrobium urmianum]